MQIIVHYHAKKEMTHSEKSEASQEWDQYKEDQRKRRADRLPVRTEQILSLRDMGYIVVQKTEYQYRINGTIDVYPIHNRYHNIKTNKRGGYKDVVEFIKKRLPL